MTQVGVEGTPAIPVNDKLYFGTAEQDRANRSTNAAIWSQAHSDEGNNVETVDHRHAGIRSERRGDAQRGIDRFRKGLPWTTVCPGPGCHGGRFSSDKEPKNV